MGAIRHVEQYSPNLSVQQRTPTTPPDPRVIPARSEPAATTSGLVSVTVAGQETRIGFERIGPVRSEPLGSEAGPISIVVLHGWGSSASVMQGLVQELARTHAVHSLEFPGHGRTPVSATAWGAEEHVEAVLAYVNQYVTGRYIILGHSNGGRIALFLASSTDPPPELAGLVLIGPSGVRRRRTVGYFVRRTLATMLKAPFSILPERAREYGLDWLRHTLIWQALGSSDYRALEGTMRETFVRTVNAYVEDRLSRITVPVLLFRGELDDAVSDEQMRVLERGISGAGFVTIEGADHYAFLGRPDIVVSGTRLFLDEL